MRICTVYDKHKCLAGYTHDKHKCLYDKHKCLAVYTHTPNAYKLICACMRV